MGRYKDIMSMYNYDDDDAGFIAVLPYSKEDSISTGSLSEYYGGTQEYTCRHEPIDVGFTHSKWVCKKCDIVLESYEPENQKQ